MEEGEREMVSPHYMVYTTPLLLLLLRERRPHTTTECSAGHNQHTPPPHSERDVISLQIPL